MEWREDDLQPRVGYLMVADPTGLVAMPGKPLLSVKAGDLLHVTIIANAVAEQSLGEWPFKDDE